MRENPQIVNSDAGASTSAMMGHNGGPSLEGRAVSVRTAWARALFADKETPVYVMAMAWAVHWYSKSDGSGVALSNQQFRTICGVSEDSVTKGKKWLRDNGYVLLTVGTGLQKTQFRMMIPPPRPAETPSAGNRPGPPLAAGPLPQGPATADPRVRQERGRIQERDSGNIPIPAPAPLEKPAPHMNGVGFVISGERGAVIPTETVIRWRDRFPSIPDLEAAMQRLSCNMLSNVSHPGWSCPEGWMAGILADINQQAKDKKRIADAKIVSTQRSHPVKTFKR